jgi:hypothetical protein
MKKGHHNLEQFIGKLAEGGKLLNQGTDLAVVCEPDSPQRDLGHGPCIRRDCLAVRGTRTHQLRFIKESSNAGSGGECQSPQHLWGKYQTSDRCGCINRGPHPSRVVVFYEVVTRGWVAPTEENRRWTAFNVIFMYLWSSKGSAL